MEKKSKNNPIIKWPSRIWIDDNIIPLLGMICITTDNILVINEYELVSQNQNDQLSVILQKGLFYSINIIDKNDRVCIPFNSISTIKLKLYNRENNNRKLLGTVDNLFSYKIDDENINYVQIEIKYINEKTNKQSKIDIVNDEKYCIESNMITNTVHYILLTKYEEWKNNCSMQDAIIFENKEVYSDAIKNYKKVINTILLGPFNLNYVITFKQLNNYLYTIIEHIKFIYKKKNINYNWADLENLINENNKIISKKNDQQLSEIFKYYIGEGTTQYEQIKNKLSKIISTMPEDIQ